MMHLCLKSIDKFYGSNHVLCDVSLDVPAGEFVVIVGPSGCGKTTLLRVVSGLERIDGGTSEMDGVEQRKSDDENYAHFSRPQGIEKGPHVEEKARRRQPL